jgi:hypothetical protein
LLFDQMAPDWRGWDGKREWTALDDEFRLTAKSIHTGHIEHVAIMLHHSDLANWRLEATRESEPGQLDELARAAKSFLKTYRLADSMAVINCPH